MGSNTIRLSIYRFTDGQIKLLLNKKEMAGLMGYVEQGVLSHEGIQVACRTLMGFRTLLDNFDIPDMHIFATASLRNIVNTEEALTTILETTGFEVDLVSGSDEAALAFHGAILGGNCPSGLLTDIGGGSTELVSYHNNTITSGCSLPMGSLSLFSSHVEHLFPTKEERKAIEKAVEAELSHARTAGLHHRHLVGVGGTIRAVGKLYQAMYQPKDYKGIVPAEDVIRIYKKLRKDGKDNLRQILRICPDRVHTILPGLAILTAVIEAYQVEDICVSTFGVREGYLSRRIIQEDCYV